MAIIRELGDAGMVARAAAWGMALAWGLAGCVSQPTIEATLIGLAPGETESTLFEQRLKVDFRLQNQGDEAIRATGFKVRLDVNGRELANGVDNRGFVVERLSETAVSAEVSTSLFRIARQLLDLANRETFDYELSGRVYLEGWPSSMPFNKSGQISREELERLVGGGNRAPQPVDL